MKEIDTGASRKSARLSVSIGRSVIGDQPGTVFDVLAPVWPNPKRLKGKRPDNSCLRGFRHLLAAPRGQAVNMSVPRSVGPSQFCRRSDPIHDRLNLLEGERSRRIAIAFVVKLRVKGGVC